MTSLVNQDVVLQKAGNLSLGVLTGRCVSQALSLSVLSSRLVPEFTPENPGSFHLSAALSLVCGLSSSRWDLMVATGLPYFWGPCQHLREGKGRERNGEGAKTICRSLPFYSLRDALHRDFHRTVMPA